MPPSSRIRELQREAEAARRERVARMTPLERMEEAYRLFALARGRDG